MRKINNKLEKFNKRKAKAQNIICKFQKTYPTILIPSDLCPDQLNTEALKIFIKLLKRKGYEALPKSIQDLKARWKQVRHRREHTNEDHLLHQGFEPEKSVTVCKKTTLPII